MASQRKSFYTVERLSAKQSLTPEGYLLCEEVPIARTGEMIYGAPELITEEGNPIVQPNDDGLIRIVREADEVFRPETIASFNGKSVTDDHPEEGVVTPLTWQGLTVGTVMNVRRGEGHENDLLLADMLVTVPSAIAAVRSGKREVSCGYEADYEELGVGEGRQTNIIGNHVALVESGRCGWRCAIGDHKLNKEIQMADKKKPSWLDRAKAAFHIGDEEGFNKALEEAKTGDQISGEPEGETHVHLHMGTQGTAATPQSTMGDDDENKFESGRVKFTDDQIEEHIAQNAAEHAAMMERIAKLEEKAGIGATDDDDKEIEGQLEFEAPAGTNDKARVANDSTYMADSFKDTVALAEILAPGIRVPTFDRAASPKKTFKDVCGLRRKALDLAYVQPATRGMIEEVLGGKELDTKGMTCDAVRTVFKAVGAMKRTQNNDAARGPGKMMFGQIQPEKSTVKSVRDMNRLYDEMHGKKS